MPKTLSTQQPLTAATRCDQDPVPRLYANPGALRLLYANTAAANDLDRNQTELHGIKLSELFEPSALNAALVAGEVKNCAQTLPLRKQFAELWDSASVEYVGLGLTRFVKVSIHRRAGAHPPDINSRSYDITARHLLNHALTQLCEQGGQAFSVRQVALRAGVGLGHLQYYYRPRIRLLEAMVDAAIFELLSYFEQQIAPRPDPGSRLLGVIDYVLNKSEHGTTLTIVRELRRMARDNAELSALLATLFQECRRLFATLFRGINPGLSDAQTLAIASDALSLIADADEFINAHPESADPTNAMDYRSHLTARILGLVHGNLAEPPPTVSAAQARTADQVAILMGVAQSMVNTHNSTERLQALCTATTRLLDSDHASIYLGNAGTFTCQSSYSNPAITQGSLSTHMTRTSNPLIAAAVATREPVVVNDTHCSALVDPVQAASKNIHAIAVVALFDATGKPCGFISSEYSQRLAGFGELHEQLLLGLAKLGESILQSDATMDRG